MEKKKIFGIGLFFILIIVGTMPIIEGIRLEQGLISENKDNNYDSLKSKLNFFERLDVRLSNLIKDKPILNNIFVIISHLSKKIFNNIKANSPDSETEYIFKEYYPGAPMNDPRVVYFAADEVIVCFFNKNVSNVYTVEGAPVIDREPNSDAVVVEVTNMPLEDYINLVEQREDVDYAELNIVGSGCSAPSDPHWDKQWGNKAINCVKAWNKYDGTGVRVAILDTGLDLNHEDIESWKCINEYNYFGDGIGSEDISDYDGGSHGTHCTGIIMAEHNNKGIAGVAPKCTVIPVKIMEDSNSVEAFDMAQGLYHAKQVGKADIICICSSFSLDTRTLKDAVGQLAFNTLLIASIGNYGGNYHIKFPAAYEPVVAVGAVEWKEDSNNNGFPDPSELRPYTHNCAGPELDIVAPGVGIYSTVNNGYAYDEGTSMATAYVAGVAALFFEKYPNASPVQCKEKLFETTIALSVRVRTRAIDLGEQGKDEKYGYGLVNAYGVVR